MPLLDLELSIDPTSVPGDVRSFLREAERRIERFQIHCHVPGFVSSEFIRAYRVIRALAVTELVPGNLFCEWGSGFGVVACLAAMLDFDACGIEIEGGLVDAARQLADDFGLAVEFVRGSFLPKSSAAHVNKGAGFAWLTADEGSAHEELGLAPDDFDVIFAYPWPDEEALTGVLFERYARLGAVLVTHHGDDHLRVRRKSLARSSRK
jgi:hypothetical protein